MLIESLIQWCLIFDQVVIINITRKEYISVLSAIKNFLVRTRSMTRVAVGQLLMMSWTRVKLLCIVMLVYQVIFFHVEHFCFFLFVLLSIFFVLCVSIVNMCSLSCVAFYVSSKL